MRIVQIANFVHERSGGIRTALDALGAHYAACGHDVMTIRPGSRHDLRRDSRGRTHVQLPGAALPGSGGYRLLVRRARVGAVIASWRPDVVEVSDRTTLSWLGEFSHQLGASAIMISHERLDLVLGDHVRAPMAMRRATDWHRRRTVDGFDLVVCASQFAATEFDANDVERAVVPFGVDLDRFHPDHRHSITRSASGHRVMLVSRLSREKQPILAVAAVAELRRRGRDIELLVAGDGPLRAELCSRAAESGGVHVLGHVSDRAHLAALLADADAVISPGPRETFGLAALEALASGTPVVAVDDGALPELLVPGAGVTCRPDARSFADGVAAVLGGDRRGQRVAARARAEQFTWDRAGESLLEHYDVLRRRRRNAA